MNNTFTIQPIHSMTRAIMALSVDVVTASLAQSNIKFNSFFSEIHSK